MNGKAIVFAVFCALVVLVQSAVFSPFHEGNLLALKQAVEVNTTCADGYLVEFTPSGQIVQEVMLTTDSANDCKLFTDDYYGRLTLSTDGARVILPCCHPDPSNETLYLVSFAIINSNGTMERTDIIQNSSSNKVVNAALNGNDIWYSQAGHVYHVINAPGNTAATEIFEQDFFQLQIYNGNLLIGNYDHLPHTIVQVGSGLPTELISGNGTAYLDTDPVLSVNAFEFLDKYLVLNMYPHGINIYNLTSQQLAYSVADTEEIGQLVSLLDQGKIIAHVHSIGNTPASIYSFPFSFADGIGSLSDAAILLTSNATEEFMFKYYSPVRVPQGSYVPPAVPTSSPTTSPISAPNTSGPVAAPTGKTPTGRTPTKASNSIVLVPCLSLLIVSLL